MSGRTFKTGRAVDFVVIGSGAAGGTIARELARAGLDVVVLEQGPRFTAADFKHDELDHWFNGHLTNKLDTNPQTFRKSATDQAQRVTDFPSAWYAPTVGGSSAHFTANYWRFHESTSASAAARRDRRAPASPTGRSLRRARAVLHARRVGDRACRACRCQPVRSAAQQAVPDAAAAGQVLRRAARARRAQARLHAYPAPMAIASVPYNDRPACVHCGFCIGFGCEVRRSRRRS
jgi:choline dehydrogenase-like flavoprotein